MKKDDKDFCVKFTEFENEDTEKEQLLKKYRKIIPESMINIDEDLGEIRVKSEYYDEANEIADKFFELRDKKKDAEATDE